MGQAAGTDGGSSGVLGGPRLFPAGAAVDARSVFDLHAHLRGVVDESVGGGMPILAALAGTEADTGAPRYALVPPEMVLEGTVPSVRVLTTCLLATQLAFAAMSPIAHACARLLINLD